MEILSTVIPTFSSQWWIYTILTIAIIWISIYFLRKLPEDRLKKWEIGLFIAMMLHEIIWQMYYFSTDTWVAGKVLPLHLCGISKIIGTILLVKYNQYVFEFLLLLGFGGALQAIMTPEITNDEYNLWIHINYYISHGFIFFAGFYQLFVRNRKIEPQAWWRSFFIGLVVLGIVGVINSFIDGNYIYLCEKPNVDNPLLIGPWPYYLTGFLVFGFINIVLFHLLFRWWGGKIKAKS